MTVHLTQEEIQEYALNSMRHERQDEMNLHLHVCPECCARLRASTELEETFRGIPLDETSANFTERVVQRLGLKESSSFAWFVFRNLAPLAALSVVIIVVYFVLDYGGALRSPQMQQSVAVGKSVYETIGSKIAGGVTACTLWMQKYLSFAFARNVYSLTIFLIAFFGAISLLDKYIFSPMMRRKA